MKNNNRKEISYEWNYMFHFMVNTKIIGLVVTCCHLVIQEPIDQVGEHVIEGKTTGMVAGVPWKKKWELFFI